MIKRSIVQTIAILAALSAANSGGAHAAFVHPGLFYTKADLARIKAKVANRSQPWFDAYKLLGADLTYTPSPVVNETIGTGQFQIRADAQQAEALALAWYITDDARYAAAAIKIINAWTDTMQSFDPADNLSASQAIQGFGEAAEILIYTGKSGWSANDIAKYKSMMRNELYPAVAKSKTDTMEGNQGIDAVMAAMAVGIALDVQQYFQDGVNAWTQHPCVAVTKFILASGENGEAGRDQPHSVGELTAASSWALLAWNQGVDLYKTASNRLLAGYEYWARYNLGNSVPYTYMNLCNYQHGAISDRYRGRLGTVDFERVYRHYVTDKGLSAPYTKQVLDYIGVTSGTLLSYAGPAIANTPILANGTYSIVSTSNGLALSTPGDSTVNAVNLDMETFASRPSQTWTFTRYAGNIYSVVNADNKVIDVPGASIDPGVGLDSYSPNGGLWQYWRVGKNADGTYHLLSAYSSWGMAITGASTSSGATVEQDFVPEVSPSTSQTWSLTP